MIAALNAEAKNRIIFLDGAMGTMIQTYRLEEADFRGDVFTNPKGDLKGNNDILCLTRPEIIEEIHTQYLQAGSDIISTNTFNSTSIAQTDYHLEKEVFRINQAAARLAWQAVDKFKQKTGKTCYVAGAIGPTNKAASLSPDVNNPGFRSVTFDELVATYYEQGQGLLAGGIDLFLIETVFDTLNLKAAIFALDQLKKEGAHNIPYMISVTITDQSGRTLPDKRLLRSGTQFATPSRLASVSTAR